MVDDAPSAAPWVPDDPSLAALAEAVQQCRGCELHERATQAVMGTGGPGADLMLLGEQPGEREDVEGRPFVGPAGQLLDRALADAGLEPDRVFRTNAVKHFRWSGTRGKRRIHQSPTRAHVAACRPWLVAELSVVRPTGLVALGGTAGQALYGTGFRVGEARGEVRAWPTDFPGAAVVAPSWVVATTHPSAVLRSRERERDYDAFVRDLQVAAEELAR